ARLDFDAGEMTPVQRGRIVAQRPGRAAVPALLHLGLAARDRVVADAVTQHGGRGSLGLVLGEDAAVDAQVDAADVAPAEVGQFDAVVGRDVEARHALVAGVGRRTDHALGVDAVQRAVGGAALDGLTAVVERQRRVQSLVLAAVHDISQAGAVDRLVDLDVVVVQAQTQARREGRLPDGADGPGVGFFRPQIRVAARLLVDLARVRRSHITDRAQRHAG